MLSITSNARALDLLPGQQITITCENPLLAEDHIPAPVSVSIEFPITANNCEAFGFTPAMMFAPARTVIPARLTFAGIDIFGREGELRFDEFSDGTLKYSFVAASEIENIHGKIHEMEILCPAGPLLKDFVAAARNGEYKEFQLPQVMCQANSAKIEYPTAAGPGECSIIDKYANHLYSETPYVVPAIKVQCILQKFIPGVNFTDDIENQIKSLAVLGLYKPNTVWGWKYGVPVYSLVRPTEDGTEIDIHCAGFNLAETLPDMDAVEFVQNILKMYCAAMYDNGNGGYEVRSNRSTLLATEFDDWSTKISDVYSIVTGQARSYSLSYANKNEEFSTPKEDDLGQELPEPEQTVDSYDELLSKIEESSEYTTVRIPKLGNIYSGRAIKARIFYEWQWEDMTEGTAALIPVYVDKEVPLPSISIVHQGAIDTATLPCSEKEASEYNCNIGFQCVKCVPTAVATKTWLSRPDLQVPLKSITPIVEFPTVGADRPGDVYIGLLKSNNMFDQGGYYRQAIPYKTPGTLWPDSASIGINGENGLYARFHREFAEWMQQERNTIKAELHLKAADICNLRLWRKIMLYNRLFFIRNIEITLTDNSDVAFANAEFIEA